MYFYEQKEGENRDYKYKA
jgi:serine/threonine protein kinase